jgi:hypothetical protein
LKARGIRNKSESLKSPIFDIDMVLVCGVYVYRGRNVFVEEEERRNKKDGRT